MQFVIEFGDYFSIICVRGPFCLVLNFKLVLDNVVVVPGLLYRFRSNPNTVYVYVAVYPVNRFLNGCYFSLGNSLFFISVFLLVTSILQGDGNGMME